MANVGNDYVMLARQLAFCNDLSNAFNMYMCAFIKDPQSKKRFEYEFCSFLSKMNKDLAAIQNTADIFKNFEKAIQVFPGNVQLLNDIGCYLYRYGYFTEALCHFEKALNIDNSHAGIEMSLNNTKSHLFPSIQFRILNDTIRNRAYRAAIKNSVTPTDIVMDIDAGAGLLSLYANECNPIVVTACESSYAISRLAECVIQDNQSDGIVVVNEPIMAIERTDIYGALTVLITDAIDSGLFGEYILQSVSYAWANLFYTNSLVIPGRAEYFIVGVKCDELYNKYKLCQDMKDILNVPNMNVHTTTYYAETYYSDDVHLFENVKYMCEPASLFTIDFNNIEDVNEKLTRQEPYNATLLASEAGEINMVIGWFNLYLTDDIMLTSDPRSPDRPASYQQAVFFDVLTKRVRKNEIMNIPFTAYGGKLTSLPNISTAIMRLSPESITYLNDMEYTSMVTKALGPVCVHLGQTVDIEQVDMVDLSPFPLFGVLMMRRGANSLICYAKTINDKAFLHTVLVANGIPPHKVTILIREYWSHDLYKDKKFHVIFNQIINHNGDLDARKNWVAHHLQKANLLPGGICLPASVTVMGELISSKSLEMNNRVLDENVDYSMAKNVNRYQVSQALNVDITTLDYESLSEPFEVTSSDDMRSDLFRIPILKDGECHAILCWYKVQLLEQWNEVYTNRSNSFVQCSAFITSSSNNKVFKGDEVNVVKCVDIEGPFKLVLDLQPY